MSRKIAQPSPAEQKAAFDRAVASGVVVLVRCSCPHRWWVISRDAKDPCHSCGVRYQAVA